MPRVTLTRLQNLFEPDVAVPKDLLKEAVVKDFKNKELIGVPDTTLRITFSSPEGSDILIQKLDPENALGYSVYTDEEDYFNHLQAELYEPTEEDILGE